MRRDGVPDTLVEACRTEGQICYGSFVWVIVFLPFWAVRATPRCHGTRLQMHALSNLAPFRAAHQFFSLAGGDGAPHKKGCILDPILQDTVGPNASAKIDQQPAWSPAVCKKQSGTGP